MDTHLLVQLRKLQHHRSTKTSSDIGGARGDVTKMVIVGVAVARILEGSLNSVDGTSPAGEDLLDVTSILHGDASHVVLLVDPNKESLVIVVEDTTSIRPVTSSTAVQENIAGTRLLEKETSRLQSILLILGHTTQRVVLALQVIRHGGRSEGIRQQGLDLASLLSVSSGRKSQTINGAASTDASRHHILIELLRLSGSHVDVSVVHVRGVGVLGLVPMPAINNQVHHFLECVVSRHFASSDTNTKVRGIKCSLDGLVKSHARGSLNIGVLGVQLRVLLKDLAQKRLVAGVDDGEVANGVNLVTGGPLGDTQVSLNALHSVEDVVNLIRSGGEADGGAGKDGRASHEGSATSSLGNSREHV
mmetsp:Transcript_7487/g.12572  ORF Transcript_7487/g.12572 Transcript_7487/m.12572 type:complete len:361 (-) Transcript_7487:21-1103(-)